MCTATVHAFIYLVTTVSNAVTTIPVGHPCICGALRWGSPEELRALDEVARCEAMWAVPWHERTRWA